MNQKNLLNRKERGITLIALVITIIVLLILAGVVISMLSGENGILKQAANASETYAEAQQDEETVLADTELAMNYAVKGGGKTISNGMMTGITPGTTVDTLQAELQGISIDYLIGDENGDTTTVAGKKLETGMTIVKNNKIVQRIIILGDINANGTVDSADRSLLAGFLLGKTTLINTEWKKVAADIDQDGDMDVDDLTLLANHVNGKVKGINQNTQVKNEGSDIVVKSTKYYINNLPETFTNDYEVVYDESTKEYSISVSTNTVTVQQLLEKIGYEDAIITDTSTDNIELSKETSITESSKISIKSNLEYGHTIKIINITVE